jgi:hypothetical protein
MMVMSRICGLGLLLLVAGCAGTEKALPSGAAAVKPAGDAVASRQETLPAPKSVVPATPVAKPDVPVAGAPAATPTPAEPIGKNDVIAPPAPKPAPTAKPAAPSAAKPAPPPAAKSPPLDLAALEKRLKETSAVGVFTKLTLKNQVDDLLERFKAHYDGRAKTTLAQLRQPYESLIFKMLAALQDGDPSLAKAVADSREAIWAILSDPNKFRDL